MSPWRRRSLKAARLLHLYLSLFSLALVLFFSATGFMLNHEDWFVPPDSVERTTTGVLPESMRTKPDRLAIVELLRKDFGAVGLVESFEPREDSAFSTADEWRVVFKRPGTEVESIIHREDGAIQSTIRTRGFNAILLDLHRGKSTGRVWSIVIDAVCVALVLMSATGLVLWSSLKSRGKTGLALLLVGLAAGMHAAWQYAM